MTPYSYPEDEFDTRESDARVPVGVHRAPVPSWRGWLPLLVVIVVVPILAWGAVTLLGRSGKSGNPEAASSASATASAVASEASSEETAAEATEAAAEPTQEATEEATPAASADMTTGVTIHNGAGVSGLAKRTGDRLTNAGYTSITVQPGVYSESEPTATTIYYADSSREATAKAIGEVLGITNVVESATQAQSNPIVIVLRSDFHE